VIMLNGTSGASDGLCVIHEVKTHVRGWRAGRVAPVLEESLERGERVRVQAVDPIQHRQAARLGRHHQRTVLLDQNTGHSD
jgi:hypothetical protein